MIARVESAACLGMHSYPVQIEVDVIFGLPKFIVVGLPDTSVKESGDRVRSAIKNSGYRFPPERIIINLAPADVKKEGPSFDLPMALGILAAGEMIPQEKLQQYRFLGELALDGSLRPFKGALAIASGMKGKPFVLPVENAAEASIDKEAVIYPVTNLQEVVQFLRNEKEIQPMPYSDSSVEIGTHDSIDFSEIRGQAFAKRAVEIAVAGGHNLLITWTQIQQFGQDLHSCRKG